MLKADLQTEQPVVSWLSLGIFYLVVVDHYLFFIIFQRLSVMPPLLHFAISASSPGLQQLPKVLPTELAFKVSKVLNGKASLTELQVHGWPHLDTHIWMATFGYPHLNAHTY